MASESNGRSERILDRALHRDPNAPLDLRRKTRFGERVIQFLLVAAGLLSIFTTIGIVGVLGTESLAFFTRQLWEQTNKEIVEAIDAEQTTFQTSFSGRSLPDEGVIRLSNEIMEIVQYDSNVVHIDVTGTGGGFERFCAGETVINNASRPIRDDEVTACNENGITPVEFRVGTDALAIVVNPANDFVDNVSFEELALIFGSAVTWADVRPEWPNEPIARFIPGTDSGTFDYFVEEIYAGDTMPIIGEEGGRIVSGEVVTSEDDNQLVRGIAENDYAVGFFGYAYYLDNRDRLQSISVSGVAPTADTAEDGTYPLARPLFIYSSAEILNENQLVVDFINYYLTHVNEEIVDVGYFPASDEALNAARQTLLEYVEGDTLPDVQAEELAGNLEIAGSSTVFPLTERIVERLRSEGYLPHLEVVRGVQGTRAVEHPAGTGVEVGDQVTLIEFFTNTTWQPAIREFGIIPLVNSTLMTSFIAMLVALPLGLGAAIYLSEYASPNIRSTLKPILEILAGIPTVVYGYFALTFMTPLLRGIFGADVVSIYNTASAGIVVGILIIPLVASMSEDALSAVPRALREASYGLGATKLETTIKVVIPAALSGILAAFIVAVSRAIGETMIVAIAAGAGPNFTFNPFESAETMTGHMARISGGDLSYDSIDYNSIFAIGLTLFVITFILNLISRSILNRFREAY